MAEQAVVKTDVEEVEETGGLKLEPHQVIMRPLVTEKGVHQSQRLNAYAFEVHQQATKSDIRKAVESLWNVRVVEVRTLTRKGKPRRSRLQLGQTGDWKKAIVQLHEEDRISFF
ncbi:50S ribosomal protein L23 [Planctomicrobium piriforme]|uniref:Large ribosomal subunit protein uL23 n=1 Tax=Planctomicrobium piriforme TaxID=1576369 RepID=A0A1I3C7L9_9PLAN|nr:50S ribosomal protein L23 [Planctomicrobium piriforme]SFH70550.1 large subunit ribosomal protein L23 [Planctomicrobium piriforme]